MLARYDLDYEHDTFDFFGWGVMAVAAGATGFVINADTPAADKDRVDSIILPGAELFGLPVVNGEGGDRLLIPPFQRWKLQNLIKFAQAGKIFGRLKSIKPAGDAKYTVTMRHYHKSLYRNSDQKLWRQFAAEIGAFVIEDYFDQPISLHDRMSLYAGAEMNFGVWSGPMFLITLTDYPCISLNWGTDEPEKLKRSGIRPGDPPPWLVSNQRVPWLEATADNIWRVWNEYRLHAQGAAIFSRA